MEKKKSFLGRLLKKKYVWVILGIIVILIGYIILKPNKNLKNIITDTAKISNLKETVLATGQVVSDTDLDLSFNSSGIVKKLNVAVGDKVKKGQVLATLNQAQAWANLTSAKGGLDAAQATLEKTLEGSTSQQIALAEVNLKTAEQSYKDTKASQDTLVENAYHSLLNSTIEATPEGSTSNYTAPVISGTYNLSKEGQIKIDTYSSGNGTIFNVSGLTTGSGTVTNSNPQPIGDSGLYVTFPSGTSSNINSWIINIPNKKASNYLLNYNAYQLAQKTEQGALAQAKSLIEQRKAELAVTTASARDSDVKLAEANVLTATGRYEQARAAYNNTMILAPANGTITSVDTKLGELASALKEVIVLQDVSNLYVESDVNEANIVGLSVGMPVDMTFDAFSSDQNFQGHIISIDPSSTLISGVVNYKVKVSVDKIPNLRPGMTANLTINVAEHNDVIAVSSRAIIDNANGTKSIRIITDSKKKTYKEVPVTTGLEGDGGLVEITSGLKKGEEYVSLIKS